MNKNKETAIAAIKQQGLLPLFYYEDAEVSLEIVRALYKGGVRVFEYTNRGKAALANFKFLKDALK
ncbi:MAG: bifunctional 4-hydroxy-2-oxoglutarate aldolase/2-dehydro-3-deoxy-phosphogluconate aldolase, partial [Bacteroidia bacterium]